MNKNSKECQGHSLLAFTFIFFISINVSFSQVSSIGIKAGGNLSTINMDNSRLPGQASRGYKPGIQFGGFILPWLTRNKVDCIPRTFKFVL